MINTYVFVWDQSALFLLTNNFLKNLANSIILSYFNSHYGKFSKSLARSQLVPQILMSYLAESFYTNEISLLVQTAKKSVESKSSPKSSNDRIIYLDLLRITKLKVIVVST